jgi:hypothetical protein
MTLVKSLYNTVYSLLDQESCPNVVLDHVVKRTLHGEIIQMKREREIDPDNQMPNGGVGPEPGQTAGRAGQGS